jgi:hypothetical protein
MQIRSRQRTKFTARTRSQTCGPGLIRRGILKKNCLDEGDKWTEGVQSKILNYCDKRDTLPHL